MKETFYWIYILKCENNTYYTGYTTDIVRRYQEHLMRTAKCKYTRSFKPLNIAQCWRIYGSKALAMQMERYIKKMSKNKKIQIIVCPELLTSLFTCSPALKYFLENK